MRHLAWVLAGALLLGGWNVTAQAQEAGEAREPVSMKVVAVNPSATKPQVTPVKIYLPTEVGPEHIIDDGGLSLEYDDEQNMYYVYSQGVELKPKETRVFEVIVEDVWYVADGEILKLRNYTELILSRLEETEYYETGKEIAESIFERLDKIVTDQADETLTRKQRIGNFRRANLVLEAIEEDLARMEKLISFTGGPPVPEMLEESELKSDAPSTTTTWMVIFLIMIFIALLGGQFFLTWHRRARAAGDVTSMKQFDFPGEDKGGPEGGP
ncbi:MAG: hypothetical protein JW937_07365 [Candidatus Omnitrophica bacterium]|nr:hypothetical protein [Candidatus Omnitrophota bacterium]